MSTNKAQSNASFMPAFHTTIWVDQNSYHRQLYIFDQKIPLCTQMELGCRLFSPTPQKKNKLKRLKWLCGQAMAAVDLYQDLQVNAIIGNTFSLTKIMPNIMP